MVAYVCNSSTPEVKPLGTGVRDQHQLHREFEASLSHVRVCLFQKNKRTLKKKQKTPIQKEVGITPHVHTHITIHVSLVMPMKNHAFRPSIQI